MKPFLLFSCLLLMHKLVAQQAYYAAAKNGLSMREQAGANAKILEKIPYGQKLELLKDTAEQKSISTEGFSGYWWKVKYNNKTGYIVSSYLLTSPPPKTGVKNLRAYFAKVSSPNGGPVVVGKATAKSIDDAAMQLTKQLYKNGMEWHESQGYEYGGEVYMLPGYTIEQAFLLLRLLNQYPELISAQEAFPVKNGISKKDMEEKTIEVERENYGEGKVGPVKRIKMTHAAGVITDFEIFNIDNQVVITWSSGV